MKWIVFVEIVKVKKDRIGYLCTLPKKKINEIYLMAATSEQNLTIHEETANSEN